jgi:glycine cleavage system pyridoxal-binding protein P
VYKSYIGLGYHPIVPPAIQRNILKIQVGTLPTHLIKQIAQGRLEAIEFQTMVIELTGWKSQMLHY